MQHRRKTIASFIAPFLFTGGCSNSADVYDPEAERAKWNALSPAERGYSPTLPPTTEGWGFDVPSDLQASYRLLTHNRMANNHLEVLTRRDGPSGTSFTRTEISCLALTYRVLGEGDAREDAISDRLNLDQMTDLMGGSIKSYTAAFACRKALE